MEEKKKVLIILRTMEQLVFANKLLVNMWSYREDNYLREKIISVKILR